MGWGKALNLSKLSGNLKEYYNRNLKQENIYIRKQTNKKALINNPTLRTKREKQTKPTRRKN